MTERVEKHLNRYPEAEYLAYEDRQPDRERVDFFLSAINEEQMFILRKRGATNKEEALCFAI